MPSGIIVLDKPPGLTSNGALQRVRKAFGAKSAGHVGTLDPMATGMLPLCLDEATKIIAEVESGAKCYEFTLQLGSRTDTGDADGAIVEEKPAPAVDAASIGNLLREFLGVQSQVPPMYSALKRDGRPLYELARKGIEVERSPRTIEIRQLELAAWRDHSLDLVCECAKGTYIRVLGEDIARRLGTVGHLTRLRRTWVEPFRQFPMNTLEAVMCATPEGGRNLLLPPDAPLQDLASATLTAEQTISVRHGQSVHCAVQADAPAGRRARMYGPDGAFLGLADIEPGGMLQPRRLLRADAP